MIKLDYKMDYTYVAPHGAGWLKVNDSAFGSGLWVKTTETGVILPDDEVVALISGLISYLQKGIEVPDE